MYLHLIYRSKAFFMDSSYWYWLVIIGRTNVAIFFIIYCIVFFMIGLIRVLRLCILWQIIIIGSLHRYSIQYHWSSPKNELIERRASISYSRNGWNETLFARAENVPGARSLHGVEYWHPSGTTWFRLDFFDPDAFFCNFLLLFSLNWVIYCNKWEIPLEIPIKKQVHYAAQKIFV